MRQLLAQQCVFTDDRLGSPMPVISQVVSKVPWDRGMRRWIGSIVWPQEGWLFWHRHAHVQWEKQISIFLTYIRSYPPIHIHGKQDTRDI